MNIRKIIILLFIPIFSFGQDRIFSDKDLTNSLKVHNQEREQLGLKKLKWSISLQIDAENYAKYLAKTKRFKHSRKNNDGENLYMQYDSKSIAENPFEIASLAWLDEKKDYKYAKIGDKKNSNVMIGHYTQMIWEETTEIGIGAYVNKKGEIYVVARYHPAGNWSGEFPYKVTKE
tara:strand:+ start:2823 stop:3347 length:525 start_codon:yes stop_codon:yes gene_type:complete